MKPEQLIDNMKKWLQKHNIPVSAGVMALCSVLVIYIAGIYNGSPQPEETVIETTTTVTVAETTVPPMPVLEKDQTDILDAVVKHLAEDNLKAAAEYLLKNEQKLEYLFYQVLEGKQYLYRDGVLFEELDGVGLVLKKPMSVFYGAFRAGRPEGEGIALQGIELDGLRYDYSQGTWKDGKLDGEGEIGYRYYEGTIGEGALAVQKVGVFARDLMEGSFSYRTTNSEGETTMWDMEAKEGKTVLDERWVEGSKEHYLVSNQNSAHAYVLPEAAAEEVRWRNMLPWDE